MHQFFRVIIFRFILLKEGAGNKINAISVASVSLCGNLPTGIKRLPYDAFSATLVMMPPLHVFLRRAINCTKSPLPFFANCRANKNDCRKFTKELLAIYTKSLLLLTLPASVSLECLSAYPLNFSPVQTGRGRWKDVKRHNNILCVVLNPSVPLRRRWCTLK